MPESEITAISVVPPPMSTIMLPHASVMGIPAPMAATIACSTRYTSLAFARRADSCTARLFDLRDFGRNADNDAGTEKVVAAVRRFDEVLQHYFGDVKIRDHSVLHRLYGDDIGGRPPEHLFGLVPYGKHLLAVPVERDDRRLIDHNPAPLRIHKGIGRPEIDGQVTGKKTEK